MAKREPARKPRAIREARARLVTLRLPERLIEHFRRAGPGYQTRIREALEQHVEREARIAAFEKACADLRRMPAKERRALAILDARPLNDERLADALGAIPD